ncbi:MAG: hypothetical protein AMS15_02575 [Planctomycetes bacterium DG_23]|nr:MAG: hypothetical protein AMS15_02575 [Planctomycetes bacterium DG_23]
MQDKRRKRGIGIAIGLLIGLLATWCYLVYVLNASLLTATGAMFFALFTVIIVMVLSHRYARQIKRFLPKFATVYLLLCFIAVVVFLLMAWHTDIESRKLLGSSLLVVGMGSTIYLYIRLRQWRYRTFLLLALPVLMVLSDYLAGRIHL